MSSLPLRYAHGNVLFGRGDERVALFRLETVSYPFLSERMKTLWFMRLAKLAFSVEADFSLWRVNRLYPVEQYVEQAGGLFDDRYGSELGWQEFLEGHERYLAGSQKWVPELYLGVSLKPPPPQRLGGSLLRQADRARRRLEDLAGVNAAQPVSGSELTGLLAAEERIFERVRRALGNLRDRPVARRATTRELQWLLRRTPCRGVAEPRMDPHWRPGALVIESEEDDTERHYEPRETDFLRLLNAPRLEEERSLVIDAEECRTHQAMLAVGGFPEEAIFPGPRAELLFAPLEGVDFPVDATLHLRWTANRAAISQVKKKILEADNTFAEEQKGQHGATWQTEENRVIARELDAYLQSEGRPPLLEATILIAVGADSPEECERRVEALRGEYGTVELHRPLGLQSALYDDHLPRAGGATVGDYYEVVTIEQFAATMPIASHHVGSERGVYIGEATGGSAQPVLFDPTEASTAGRATAMLMVGTPGSGKTVGSELLAFVAERRGSLVVTVDPKPDHGLDRVKALAGRVSIIELSGEERYRGLLDPLRIAAPSLREDLTASYLMELLPQAPPAWETHVRRAVKDAIAQDSQSSLDVLERLRLRGHSDATDAFEALEVWADSGLGRLAFSPGAVRGRDDAERAVTTIRADALTLPVREAQRKDWAPSERLAVATLKLVATYAMRLASDPSRHAVVLLDEAWMLLESQDGRRLVDRLARLGRSQNVTLILATQRLGDVGEVEELVGTRMIFKIETPGEAKRALTLLGLDEEDEGLVQRLRDYEKGLCLMRDINDRVAEVQIELVYDDLLHQLDTSPGATRLREEQVEAAA